MSVEAPSDAWFDEIDLDPNGAWLRMGTRNLGSRPWLVVDEQRDHELALKRRLLTERHREVFAAAPDSLEAASATRLLIEEELASLGIGERDGDTGLDGTRPIHPLDRAGRRVQEDLCLLRPADGRWVLAAASLCFPSRWRLADKFERELALVHGPVEGYAEQLGDRVDRLLGRLGSSIVWRRNWFIHPDESLFQPNRPANGDPLIQAERCLDRLHLRSERQTLRRVGSDGWVLFTIRVQQTSLRRFTLDPDRRGSVERFVVDADSALSAHKGLSKEQCFELQKALAQR